MVGGRCEHRIHLGARRRAVGRSRHRQPNDVDPPAAVGAATGRQYSASRIQYSNRRLELRARAHRGSRRLSESHGPERSPAIPERGSGRSLAGARRRHPDPRPSGRDAGGPRPRRAVGHRGCRAGCGAHPWALRRECLRLETDRRRVPRCSLRPGKHGRPGARCLDRGPGADHGELLRRWPPHGLRQPQGVPGGRRPERGAGRGRGGGWPSGLFTSTATRRRPQPPRLDGGATPASVRPAFAFPCAFPVLAGGPRARALHRGPPSLGPGPGRPAPR